MWNIVTCSLTALHPAAWIWSPLGSKNQKHGSCQNAECRQWVLHLWDQNKLARQKTGREHLCRDLLGFITLWRALCLPPCMKSSLLQDIFFNCFVFYLPEKLSKPPPLVPPGQKNLENPVWVLLSLVSVIKDQGKGFYNSKSIELYITIWKLNARTHTKLSSNLRRWSWVGSCVLQRLMKASHLKDRSEDGARSECFQRDPNDLWELKHQRSLPLHNLPLISLCSLPALGYPVSERERREPLVVICCLIHWVFLQATWFGPIDVLIGAAIAGEQTWR